MNSDLHRLIFNRERGLWMAVSEWARSRGKRSASGRARRIARFPARAVMTGVLAAMSAGAFAAGPLARGTVPVPVNAGGAGFVSSGAATLSQAATASGNALTINQRSLTAVLNWNSFNIANGSSVNFVQPSSGAAALNRIGDANPTIIQGQLTANGQVYLYNANGILFDKGAQVNVGGLVASALNISDDVFVNGLLTAGATTPVFNWTGSASGYSASMVRVEAGANITTPNGGSVLMFAPRVENLGHIETPEGQTMLAAGAKVYLASPLDARLRGFLVEVDPFSGNDSNGNPVNLPGTVTNQKLGDQIGEIIAERGNITLAGLAVNQQGHLKVTTSVDRNGSIYLLARDTVTPVNIVKTDQGKNLKVPLDLPQAKRMGTLTFGAGSVTEALPDYTDTRALTDDQTFNSSSIVGAGKNIQLEGAGSSGSGARLTSTGGSVALTASDSPQCPIGGDCALGDQWKTTPGAAGAQLYAGSGSVIDVSGVQNVDLSVSRNVIEVELRGSQLADAPLQRNGILYGKKVLVDIRTGTPLANINAELNSIKRGIAEKSSTGGTIQLASEGSVAVTQGATLNVSGGSLNYRGGDVGTSVLISGSQSVDIGSASPDMTYTSYIKDTFRYDPGYVEGRNAGSVQIVGDRVALDGTLTGNVTAGIYQRDASTHPLGGLLQLGVPDDPLRTLSSAVNFVNSGTTLGPGYQSGDAVPATIKLDSALFSEGGFDRLSLATTGKVSIPQDVTITTGPNGAIAISAQKIDVEGSIVTPGGTISLASQDTSGLTGSVNPADYNITVGSHALLSTAGLRSIDINGLQTGGGIDPIELNGGAITLKSVADLMLAPGSVLDVSGGGWLQLNGKYQFGNAGSIALSTGRFNKAGGQRGDTVMTLAGTLSAYAMSDGNHAGNGGTLNLSASNVSIGGDPLGIAGELHLGSGFFDQGGFQNFSINGTDGLSVAANTRVAPTPRFLMASLLRNGGVWTQQLTPAVLPVELRDPANLTLSAKSMDFGRVTVGQGANLEVDPGGKLALNAGYAVVVDGTLSAPGGTLSISLPVPTNLVDQYLNDRGIWLGSHASVLAQGYTRLTPDPRGLRQGIVHDGGSITLDAANGYLVTQAGSLIDASGTQSTLDLRGGNSRGSGYQATLVGSKGGAVSLAAREGMLLDGTMRAPGGAGALGGSLIVNAFDQRGSSWVPPTDPALQAILSAPRRLLLASTFDAGTGAMTPGQGLDTATRDGVAVIAADRIASGGFADLALSSWDRIETAGQVSIAAARSITLESPNLKAQAGATLSLAAAEVWLGNTRQIRQDSPVTHVLNPASGGDARLLVDAGNIDLAGNVALQGFGQVDLSSSGDLRARGAFFTDITTVNGSTVTQFHNTGSLHSGGDIHLAAARIYPDTLSDFTFAVDGNPTGTIMVTANGSNPAAPLSAGGRLALQAPHIVQNGTLRAPFGAIDLIGTTIDLGAGSVTSVSAQGLTIPFGMTDLSGTSWLYGFGGASQVITTPPEKRVSLQGDQVNVAQGASIDLSGGGDMSAWEFIAGPGGSKDVLAPANSPNTYAIVPGLNGGPAPYDLQNWQGVDGLRVGDAIKLLDSVGGLVAGTTYTLLPARYALLNGAYTVTFTGALDAAPGQTQTQALPDGSVQAAALRTSLVKNGHLDNARNEAVVIAPGTLAGTKSEFKQSLASTFFSDNRSAQQPGDAGHLTVLAGSALTLDGTLNTAFVSTHRGAEVDIAANLLSVVGQGRTAQSGYVALSAEALNKLGASSLLLGGTRTATNTGATINVSAQKVDIDTGATTELAAPTLIIAATDSVTLEGGSRVAGKGVNSGTPKDLSVNGDGALLRASSAEQVALSRSGTTRSQGTLDVKTGATVSGRSVILDATLDNLVEGNVNLDSGGALTVGASRISAGETAGISQGLVFSNDRLAALGNPAAMKLKSYSSLDLYGNVVLGNAPLQQLDVESSGIVGYANAGKTAQLAAQQISLSNPDGQTFSAPGTPGSGTLALNADTIVLGAGDFTVKGFGASQLTASGDIRGKGTGSHRHDGDLVLTANRITGAAGSSQQVIAGGMLTTAAPGAETGAGQDFGAALTLSAQRITHGGHIDLRSGVLTLEATGGGSGDDVTLAAGSTIDTRGVAQVFADTVAYAPGGKVTLTSDHGNVGISAGASVDVSGVPGGNAGTLKVNATEGAFTNQGSLSGSAAAAAGGASPVAGQFFLDAKTLPDFTALNTALNTGGFFESRSLRLRSGDIDLAAGQTLKAHQVQLIADAGSIDIAGTIDASGASGGSIDLYAKSFIDGSGNNSGGTITLENGGKLLANATEYMAAAAGTEGRGGSVTIGVDGAGSNIALNVGGLIDVSLAQDADGILSRAPAGKVTLRAPRVTNAADITAYQASTTSIGATSYTISLGLTQYTAGTVVQFTAAGANLGASTTINVNGIGDKGLFNNTAALAANDIAPGQTVVAVYDGASFQLLPSQSTTALSALGTNNDYRLNGSGGTPYYQGQILTFRVSRTNQFAQAPTINLRNQGAVPLVKSDGSTPVLRSLQTNVNYVAVYDGGSFRILSNYQDTIVGVNTQLQATTITTSPSGTVENQSTAYVAAIPSVTNYVPGMVVTFASSLANTGGGTLNINNLGALNLLRPDGSQLVSGDLLSGQAVTAVYDGTSFRITSAAADGTLKPDYGTSVAIAPVGATIKGTDSVAIDAYKAYSANGDFAINNASRAAWKADNFAFATHMDRIAAALNNGRGDPLRFSLQPGIELRATGNIIIGDDWNLANQTNGIYNWRYGADSAPGTLTLRAAGNLQVNANLSDGFNGATSSAVLLGDTLANVQDQNSAVIPGMGSWTYRLTSGADLGSANPQAIAPGAASGDLAIAAGKLVRTGTGDIEISAGRDLVMGNGASIYTAGLADYLYGTVIPKDANGIALTNPDGSLAHIYGRDSFNFLAGGTPQYARAGGDVNVSVGRNIEGTGASSWVTNWLYRQGSALNADGTLPANYAVNGYNQTFNNVYRPTWWVQFSAFTGGIGALGGGDVNINAGGNISTLATAVPTNGRLYGDAGTVPDPANLVVHGGGNLSVVAAGNIVGSEFYAERGSLNVAAGGALGAASGSSKGVTVALGEASATLYARGDVQLDAVLNPTLTVQPSTDSVIAKRSYFTTYGGTYDNGGAASLSLTSLDGNVAVTNDILATGATLVGSTPQYPASVRFAALQGGIHVAGGMSLAPNPAGALELLAGGGNSQANGNWDSIRVDNTINMSDLAASAIPSVFNPGINKDVISSLLNPIYQGVISHGADLLHAGDTQPVRFVALAGDIVNNSSSGIAYLPKKALFSAGRDLVNFSIFGQNLSAGDVTQFIAGRDIIEPTVRGSDGSISDNPNVFEWGGPGRAEFIAGRNIDLGASKGIVSRGNLNNPFLPDQGVNLFLQAGARSADYAGFLALLDAPGQDVLRQRAGYEAALTAFVSKATGNTAPGFAAARNAFDALPDNEKHALLNNLFYAVLRESGRAAAQSNEKPLYDTGYAAIAAMFPGIAEGSANPYTGDINLFLSQIKTEQGGDISFMAPGGQINAGLANAGSLNKSAADLGIVTARGGSISAFASDSFQVNQSRVFALATDGNTPSDILIWSSWGDIDAGKGAKTATATPPPVLRYDQASRSYVLDVSNAISGSGIGALSARDGVDAGNVDLYAPTGVINAGDAGIRAGQAFLGATAIKGADNITVTGAVVGLAAAAAAPVIPVATPGQSDTAAQAAQQAAALARGGGNDRVDNALLLVEVLGAGSDVEALTDSGDAVDEDERKKRKAAADARK